MKVSRAVVLLDLIPKLGIDGMTREEAHVLNQFLFSMPVHLTKNMARLRLANEMNVNKEALDQALGDMSVVEGLVMECTNKGGKVTLEEIYTYFTSENDIEFLPMCALLNHDEGEFVWRWALQYRWNSVKTKFSKWLRNMTGTQEGLEHDYLYSNARFSESIINALYDGVTDINVYQEIRNRIPKLQFWVSKLVVPEQWWFVPDGSSLRWVDRYDGEIIARHRTGEIDMEMTEELVSKSTDTRWVWRDKDGFYVDESTKTVGEWTTAISLLQLYPRSMILIYRDNTFHYQTGNDITLYARVMGVRKLAGGYQFKLGFRDGDEIVDTTTVDVHDIPFTIQSELRHMGIRYNYGRDWHDIDGCVVTSVSPKWTPEGGWGWTHLLYESEMGINDVSDVIDYQNIMGETDE